MFLNLGVDKRTGLALTDPQLANSYSYARNNPLVVKDPTGELGFFIVPLLVYAPVLTALAVNSGLLLAPAIIDHPDMGARVAPVAGDAIDFSETLSGRDVFTGEPLTISERLIAGVASFLPVITGKLGRHITANFDDKILGQLEKRGWTMDGVENTIQNPARTENATDFRHNPQTGTRNNDPATAYFNDNGHYVIQNDNTGDIVQVSNQNDSNWKSQFDSD